MKILKTAGKAMFGLTGLLLGSKKKSTPTPEPAPLPVATRDDARSDAEKRLDMLRRRGGAADIIGGAGGMEAGLGGKTTLGS